MLDRRESQRARRTTWRFRLLGAWSGLRGAVSLAAALALPLDFPERGLIIWLTLCVIFATLVGQGLTLPWLLRRLGIEDDGGGEREELLARREATAAAIAHLERLGEEEWTRDDTVERMLGLYRFRDRRLRQRAGERRRRRGGRRPRRPVAAVPEDGPPGARRPAPPRHRAA